MSLIEKIIEHWLRKYKIITLAFFVFLSTIILVLGDGWIRENLRNIHLLGVDIPIADGIFYNIFLFIGLVLLVFIFLFLWEKFSYIRLIFRSNKVVTMPPISKWKFQGSLKITDDSLAITSSDLGCLMERCLYKNFLMSFNLKIINGGRVGIIFRAQDLENYLMLQIELARSKTKITNGDSVEETTIIYDIVPWIRVWGDFENFRPYFRPGEEFFLKYRKLANNEAEKIEDILRYKLEKGVTVNLKVKDEKAILKILSEDKLKEFCWDIPTHTKPNIISLKTHKSKDKQAEGPDENIFPEQKSASDIWFRNKYGKIGFRADNLEKAIISDLRIEKI